MMVSWFGVIVAAVILLLVVFVVLRITMGSGRYGRQYDHAARHRQTIATDRPESEERDDSGPGSMSS